MSKRSKPVAVEDLPPDLGVDWSKWSDGRAFRLKRKRDFPNIDPGIAREACELAAHRMGKAVRTARDRRVPSKLLWIQFADAYVREGQPCPKCGSRKLYRLHANFTRCVQCNAQLIISAAGLDSYEDDTGTVGPRARERAGGKIKALENVRLERAGESASSEVYNGYGLSDGTPVIILAEFEKDEGGQELSTRNMFERVSRVKLFPADSMAALVDVGRLTNRDDSTWDLVL